MPRVRPSTAAAEQRLAADGRSASLLARARGGAPQLSRKPFGGRSRGTGRAGFVQSTVSHLMQGPGGCGRLRSMTRLQENPEDLDELTDDEEAELMDRLREAEEHPERLISNDEVVRPRKKLAG